MTDTKISLLGSTDTDALRAKVLTPKGALVTLSADLTTQNHSAGLTVAFNTEVYDTDGIHDTVTNNQRLTVPAGVSWVELSGNIFASALASGAGFNLYLNHRNSAGALQSTKGTISLAGTAPATYLQGGHSFVSAPIAVAAGDYFEIDFWCTDSSITILARSWFCMKILA